MVRIAFFISEDSPFTVAKAGVARLFRKYAFEVCSRRRALLVFVL